MLRTMPLGRSLRSLSVLAAVVALCGCKGVAKFLEALAEHGASSGGNEDKSLTGTAPEGELVVPEAQTYPGGLVADETYLYWTTTRPRQGTVYRARFDGSEVTAISESVASLEGLAIDAEHVYFLDGSRLMAVPKAGGETRELFDAKTLGPPTGIGFGMAIGSFAVDPSGGGKIFVVTHEQKTSSGKLERRSWRTTALAKAGGAPTTTPMARSPGTLVGLDASHVFVSTGQNDLVRVPRTLDGPAETVAEFGMFDPGACRQSNGGRLCCQTRKAFRCLDAEGKSLASTPCDPKKLELTDLVAIDGDDAFFTETHKEPRRLLRCDLRSGTLTGAMHLAGKNDAKSAFVRGGYVYALVFRDPSGVIAKARAADRISVPNAR